MTKFVISFLLLGLLYVFVTGETSPQANSYEPKQTSVLMLIYNFMSDVSALKSEIRDLKYEISDNTDKNNELSKEISKFQDLAKENAHEINKLYALCGNINTDISENRSESSELRKDISKLQALVRDNQDENSELSNDLQILTNENEELKSQITEQKEKNGFLEAKLLDLEISSKKRRESGATYVRWGRTECPNVNGTVKVYDGYAAGDNHVHAGGGVELLCLPKQPTWGSHGNNIIGHAFVYGTEYEIADANSKILFGKPVLDQNVPCVLCQSVGRSVAVRIPGRTSCYGGWTEEYRGYLFAGHHKHAKSTDYTCVDSDPESIPGKRNNENGRLLYPVEASCDPASLICPPYIHGRELACVICTK